MQNCSLIMQHEGAVTRDQTDSNRKTAMVEIIGFSDRNASYTSDILILNRLPSIPTEHPVANFRTLLNQHPA